MDVDFGGRNMFGQSFHKLRVASRTASLDNQGYFPYAFAFDWPVDGGTGQAYVDAIPFLALTTLSLMRSKFI